MLNNKSETFYGKSQIDYERSSYINKIRKILFGLATKSTHPSKSRITS